MNKKLRMLTGGGYWTSAPCEELGIPGIRFSDGPAGVRPQGDKGDNLGENKSAPATCFPSHSSLACSWNTDLIRGVGARIGREANYFGVDILLAPAVNLKRDVLCGRNFEYFSEDPYFNGKAGAAYSLGVSSSGAGACLKHFAANNREFGRMVSDSVTDTRTLRELYLTSFEIAVKEGNPSAVMTAYNKLNGEYCSESKTLITDILRGEWGFDGLVISDWGGTYDRVKSVKAGCDLEMPPCAFSSAELMRGVSDGNLKESEVDACIGRIKNVASRIRQKTEGCDFEEHERYAKECARECAVLLKNGGALPLKGGKTALVGDIAVNPVIQGGGSSKVNPKNTYNLYGCLKDEICGFERGYTRGKSKKLAKRALKLCKKSDAVIFCAGHYGDAEGADRESIFLPDEQLSLLKQICALNKTVIVVLFCGSAVDTSWDGDVNAVLYAGLSGQAGAEAVAEILTGKVNPSGKLCESFPASPELLRVKNPYAEIYSEGMNVGYRAGKAFKYPFGHGLSYTKFGYENLTVGVQGASFDVINQGSAYGGETAQMYICFPKTANSPELQLKGFSKVFLGAGGKKRVTIPFDTYSFRSFDTLNSRWVTVAGEYKILIGSSSADIRLCQSITKDGAAGVGLPDAHNLTACVHPINRDKRGRVIADPRTPLSELKNAKGLFGRLFSKIILHIVRNRPTVYGTMQYLPLRTLAQFGKFGENRLNGFIMMCNGKPFRGLIKMFKKDKNI